LHEAGWKQQKRAEAFGGRGGAVSHWLKKAKTQGDKRCATTLLPVALPN
jgi:hypothetical protein